MKTKNILFVLMILGITMIPKQVVFGQVIKAFTQRSSNYTPTKLVYNIQGDYTMIGNSNMTLQSYSSFDNNSNNVMIYNDVDGDPNTLNSSSADLTFSTENGAIPGCSKIIYAGLYWTGRASNAASSPESFTVTKGSLTKTLNKRTISLKGPGQANYTQFTANTGNIYYPDGPNGHMYSGYIEVTDYIQQCGLGTYTAADIALIEGNGGATGYYGGWGLIVVYENSKMNWRDVTIFDGHAYVVGNTSISYELPVSGFQTVQSGNVNMKLGMMAGEGDVGISGDYFRIRNWQNTSWVTLNHSGNSANNFFNGSVNTGGNARNPNLQNNTGMDIAMFNVPNAGNSVMTNNQTSTRFQYGSNQDTYIVFCIAMSVDAYIPDVEAFVSAESINGIPVGSGPVSVEPGEVIEYKVQIKNQGTEAINNAVFTIPIPYTTTLVGGSILNTVTFAPLPTPNNAYFDPTAGPTGSVIWDFGTLPLITGFPDSILAELSFDLTVTTDCNVLANPDCPPKVAIGGIASGQGAVSGSEFALQFIQGYETGGLCVGEPIKDPLIIDIDAATYLAANCSATPVIRDFVFCNFTGTTLPYDSVAQFFPPGLSFYNTNNVTPTSIKYDENNPFPVSSGSQTFFAIPDGINYCYYTFTITVQGPIVASAVQTSAVSCTGATDGALNLTVSGGASPYTYSWTGPGAYTASTEDISNLGAGTYTIQVVDNLGCEATNSATISTIPDVTPPLLTCPSNTVVSTSTGCQYTQTGNTWNASATDNCTLASVSVSLGGATLGSGLTTLNGVNFNLGTTTVTWTATDAAGNSSLCSFTITVQDIQTPSILTCGATGDQTVSADPGECNYTQSGTGWDATANDNCSVTTIAYTLSGATTGTGTSLNNVSFNLGTTLVNWTATDGSGNFISCSYLVTVQDNQLPSFISCGAAGTQTVVANTGVCTYTHTGTAWDATATDNCTTVTLSYTLTGATTGTGTSLNNVVFNQGTTTVTWKALDGSGNFVTCSFDVQVGDDQNPAITNCASIGNQIVAANVGVCTYTHNNNTWNATATDNCTVSTLLYTLSGATTGTGTSLNGRLFNLGVTTVTWVASDAAGNTETCQFTVTVQDTQFPTMLSCGVAGNQTVSTDLGECDFTQTGTGWDATASDNCSVASITYNLTGATTGTGTSLNNVSFNLGTTLVTWTATDGSGNSSVCTFNVLVRDMQLPAILTCGAGGNQTVPADLGECDYTQTGTGWDATASDNCSLATLTYTLTGATTGSGTSLNNVSFNLGTTLVTWTATDGSGNFTSCSYSVTVQDNQLPSFISCGAAGTQTVVANTGVCTYTHTGTAWDATATDNCTTVTLSYTLTGATTGTGTSLNNVVFNQGTTTVTWKALDGSGNFVTCSFDVQVGDDQNPAITNCASIGNQIVAANVGVCTYTHNNNTWNATATDNCTVSTLLYTLSGATTGTGTSLNGRLFNLGVTTVTWVASDAAGNTETCQFTVTVQDTQLPIMLSCGAVGNQTVVTDLGECDFTQTGTGWDATANDNCSIASIIYTLTGATTGTGTSLNNVSFNLGTTLVTWTATDGSGNTSSCSYTVLVRDTQLPAITSCGATGNQNVTTDNGACTYTQTGTAWDATATDNCTVTSLTYSLSGATTGTGESLAGVSFNQGITTVTWTAIDTANNQGQCQFTVTVVDDEFPAIANCPSPIVQNNDNGDCGAIVNWTVPSFTDNCGAVMTGSHTPNTFFPVGNTTVTYTVVDNAGNTSTCSFSINVVDAEQPVISCPDTIASCNPNVAFDLPTVSDNCGVDTIIQTAGLPSGSNFPVGLTVNVFQVTDIHGNTATCSFTVRIYPIPVSSTSVENVTCFGFGDGSIDLTLNNGAAPYQTNWSNGQATEDLTGLTPGTYTVNVTDNNGCTTADTVVISQPSALTLDGLVDNVSCYNQQNGDILISVGGGTLPYAYNWSNGQITEDLNGLDTGTYVLNVTDGNGCQIDFSATITQPDTLTIQAVVYGATCNAANGSIQTLVTGGTTPYTFDWSNGSVGPNLNNVPAGTYTLDVLDAQGCQVSYTGEVLTETNLTATILAKDVSCYAGENGELTAIVSNGNEPYTYSWSNGATTAHVEGLTAGSYNLLITDVFGCAVNLIGIINQPDTLTIDVSLSSYLEGYNVSSNGGTDGYISTSVSGGIVPYAYYWSNGDTTALAEQLAAGDYLVVVTDHNNCVSTITVTLTQPDILEMPQGFSPNEDGENDFFVVHGIKSYPENTITVFNRWGNIVYQKDGYADEWYGENTAGEALPDATYFVILKAMVAGKETVLQGYVDLRRK
jgi:gliding motility-associated-like protein/uncharacterized repeat protein (TIGR01451 family)